LCIFIIVFVIDSKVMLTGNTHAAQVSGLHNGMVSFLSLWCFWHMHAQEVLSMLRTLNLNINRPIHTWETFKPPHHLFLSFSLHLYVFLFLHAFMSLSLPLFESLFFSSLSFYVYLCLSLFLKTWPTIEHKIPYLTKEGNGYTW
jgi:hypothetical protein